MSCFRSLGCRSFGCGQLFVDRYGERGSMFYGGFDVVDKIAGLCECLCKANRCSFINTNCFLRRLYGISGLLIAVNCIGNFFTDLCMSTLTTPWYAFVTITVVILPHALRALQPLAEQLCTGNFAAKHLNTPSAHALCIFADARLTCTAQNFLFSLNSFVSFALHFCG